MSPVRLREGWLTEATSLRAQGLTYGAISDAVGVSAGAVYRHLNPMQRQPCACGCGGLTSGLSRSAYIKGHTPQPHGRQVTVTTEGCWLTANKPKPPDGYVFIRVLGKRWSAHRWYYEQHVGPIPAGLQLDHLCRNRACVNPAHLEPVTLAENIRRGLNAKLSPPEVREIRAASGETNVALAARYGVTPTQVGDIRRGKKWVGV